jgi:hypothetical protein
MMTQNHSADLCAALGDRAYDEQEFRPISTGIMGPLGGVPAITPRAGAGSKQPRRPASTPGVDPRDRASDRLAAPGLAQPRRHSDPRKQIDDSTGRARIGGNI